MVEQLKEWVSRGRELYEKGEYDQAEQFFLKVLEHSDSFADIHNMLGVVYHNRGSLEAARQQFESALSINPRYTEAALNLVVTYNEMERYEDAAKVYHQALSLGRSAEFPTIEPFAKGKIANLHAEVAQAYVEVGMLNEAVHEMRKAIGLCPQFADLRLRLANIYRQWNEPIAAKLELEQAIAIRPAYIPARVTLGVVLLMLGHNSEAVQQWNEALTIDPDNKAVQLYLRMAESAPQRQEESFPKKSDPAGPK
jgi:tetratricopeptide (TPR) repeat protein